MDCLCKDKIVSKVKFLAEIKPALRGADKKVALCHGVFDLLHPGHIIHLEQAKGMADILVVSVTAAQYVRKGPDRPYFDDEMRMRTLAALECVDYVMLSEGYTVDDIVECVEPDLYVKGEEYTRAEDDITGKITEEKALVVKHGGTVAFTGGQVFSSTKLINRTMPVLSSDVKEYMEEFHTKYSMQDIRDYADQMQNVKTLVIGDVIIDEYIYCITQGLMSKDMGYSTRYQRTEQYLGGSLAVARHIASFCSDVTLMGVVGLEESIHSRLLNDLGDKMRLDLIYSAAFPTIVKSRYVSENEKREELGKIFAINNLPTPMKIDDMAMDKFKRHLREKIQDYDAVILCDFGHGLIDPDVMEILQENAKFLAVNCQTNSSNLGKNLITKYRRADVFTLDQRELDLAFSNYHRGEEEALLDLAKHFGSSGWLTTGSRGAVLIEDGVAKSCPAFTLKVKDTIGAGDAFYALASMMAAVGAPMEVGTFMGNISGALAANIVGNKEAVEKVNVMKYASTLMNV